MKRIIIALILVLALGCVAVAEGATEAPAQPTNDAVATDNASAAEDAPAEDATAADDAVDDAAPADDALAEALEALHKARMEKAEEELKAELDEYVAAGKLTQEQADLILKHFQKRFQDMQCNEWLGGDFFDDWMNGDQWDDNHSDGKDNHIGGQKQYGNWKFGWSFDWSFPGQEDEDNPFRDMFGWNHM